MDIRTSDAQFTDAEHRPECLLDHKKLELMTSDQLDGLLASVVQQKATGDATWLLARRAWLESMDMTSMIIREQLNLTKHAELNRKVALMPVTPVQLQVIAKRPVSTIGAAPADTKPGRAKQRLALARRYLELTSTASVAAIADSINNMSDGKLDVSHRELQAELERSGEFVMNGRLVEFAAAEPKYFVYRS